MFYYQSQTKNVILTVFIVVLHRCLCLRSAWTDHLLLLVIAWNKHEWPSEGMFKDTVQVIEMYHPIKVSSMERRQWNTLRTIWPYAIIFQQQLWIAWNSKSVSGSKWLKIIELFTCSLPSFSLFYYFSFTIIAVFSQVMGLLSRSLFPFPLPM